MQDTVIIPTYDALMNPLLEALSVLGGSATIEELVNKVAEIANLSEEQMQVAHGNHRSEVEYRLAWTRTYLKAYGLIDNSTRGVWSLTPEGKRAGRVDTRDVVRHVVGLSKGQRTGHSSDALPAQTSHAETLTEAIEPSWQEQVLDAVIKMSPDAFERLAQRILREAGFVQVEVTGRSGDGGIDGKGILRLGGVLSFHINFQCKRWQNVVGPATIREFRGAMMGRADKGLIITTSSFTKEAQREAARDGAAAIDLVDGEQLVDRLKQYGLGVSVRRMEVEEVAVDPAWFREFD